MEQKSERYLKAESRRAAFLFVIFCLWCPIYLIVVRPIINAAIAAQISSYPAMLHLIPIIAPIVLIALMMIPFMPPKNDVPAKLRSTSTGKEK
ncbi:hypothetical protein [Dyella tabacisoli]|uniref:Uncharacterized protein n=1 Tax=Dyella tabacisoli TaxID=2282381 RepID=A0A369ULX1_9GAMM|nr:hypothetical protein [Dyella tabacisoli]RDD81531.1 hypothetical protein DVJ77_10140 [Dyella tabacisoli]